MNIPAEFENLEGIRELVSVLNPQDVNCHKAVLYLAKVISYQDLTSDSKKQREDGEDFTFSKKAIAISDKPFVSISDTESLIELALAECKENVYYIGQILDAEDGEMAHSFILIRHQQSFTCFDKEGFKKPFSTYELPKLLTFQNYENQKWRFLPLSEAKL